LGKTRTLQRAVSGIVNHLDTLYTPDIPLWVTVLHGQLATEAEKLAADLKEHLDVQRLEVMRVTPILGVHTGPGIVGAAALPFELVSNLL
jgi:fatty acid-binding protein DegV